jgi:type IV pilus assembly protein PilM
LLKLLPDWLPSVVNAKTFSAIGIELREESINLVQLARHGTEVQIHAAATLTFEGSREQLIGNPALVKKLLKPVLKASFHGSQVNSCLPPEFFKLLYVNYRLTKTQNEEEAITNQMRERLTGDLDDYVIDYLPVRTQSANADKLALVSVSPRVQVIQYLELLRKAGLDTQALEIGPVALTRLLSVANTSKSYDNHMTITFGQQKSFLSVHSGRRLLLDRAIELGENQVIEKLCEALDIDQEFAKRMLYREVNLGQHNVSEVDASLAEHSSTLIQILKPLFSKIVTEINRAMSYTASQTRGEPIKYIFLLGNAARWPLARHLLENLINIPVHVIYPIGRYEPLQQYFQIPQHLDEHCLAVTTGLALRGFDS